MFKVSLNKAIITAGSLIIGILLLLFIYMPYETNDDDHYVYLIKENHVVIQQYIGNKRQVVIPNEIDGYPVKEIESFAFYDKRLRSVSIPSSIIKIGEGAFNKNNLPEDQAFIYKRKKNGSIDDTVLISYGGKSKNVIIPPNVITVDDYAFYNSKIQSVYFPDSVLHIKLYAFADNELDGLRLPESLIYIGAGAFSNNKITHANVSEKVEYIGNNAFYDNPIKVEEREILGD